MHNLFHDSMPYVFITKATWKAMLTAVLHDTIKFFKFAKLTGRIINQMLQNWKTWLYLAITQVKDLLSEAESI
jgi:hypothetical protein